MALFGDFDSIARVLAADPRFQPGLRYIRRCLEPGSAEASRLRGMGDGSVEEVHLQEGSVTFDQVYRSKPRSDCFFESHRKFIDIQFVLEGEEVIDVFPTRDLAVEKPYRAEKDVIKYRDKPGGSRIHLGPGQAAVFFPEDGHMPGQCVELPTLVRKTVVKVPVDGPIIG